jgi:SAM-dependent methyltransferase
MSSYDATPFVSYPSPERTPARLWTIGRARELICPSPSCARVLEVGCSTGDLLLAQCELYPNATFIGIDPSTAQIEIAKQRVDQLKFKNIGFFSKRFQDFSDDKDGFDFIICHGVYSWIAEDEQKALLRFIKGNLSKSGVAYVSHNALPGWGVRQSVRELLRRSDFGEMTHEARIVRARELLELAKDALVDAYRPYGLQLKEEIERNLQRSDAFFVHELFAENTSGEWLSDVMTASKEVGLQYLGDAHPQRCQVFDPRFEEIIPSLSAQVKSLPERAQYLDTLFPASFRGTLLAHEDAPLRESFQFEFLKESHLSSPLVYEKDSVADNELLEFTMVPFYGPSEQVIEPKAPVLKQILKSLSNAWPGTRPLRELLNEVANEVTFADGEEQVVG